MSDESPQAHRATFQKIAVGLSIVFSLGLAEVFLRLASPRPDPFTHRKVSNPWLPSEHSPGLEIHCNTGDRLIGISGPTKFSTNEVGLRGPSLKDPSPGDIRIFCIGGSTTECFFLDDADAWPRVLEGLLRAENPQSRIDVWNAGHSGDRTDHHLPLLTQRILHLEPTIVVFLTGINDLKQGITDDIDALHRHGQRWKSRKRASTRYFRWGLTEFSHLARVLWAGKAAVSAQVRLDGAHIERKQQLVASLPLSQAEINQPDPAPYERNLRALIGICQSNGVIPIVMTQPHSWSSKMDPSLESKLTATYLDGKRHPAAALATLLDNLNGVTSSTAKELGAPVLDLASVLPKTSEVFFDDCHFNTTGSHQVGKLLAEFITRSKLLPQAK